MRYDLVFNVQGLGFADWGLVFKIQGAGLRDHWSAFELIRNAVRCRANMAHIRQTRPDSGLDFQLQVLETFQAIPPHVEAGCSGAMYRSQPL